MSDHPWISRKDVFDRIERDVRATIGRLDRDAPLTQPDPLAKQQGPAAFVYTPEALLKRIERAKVLIERPPDREALKAKGKQAATEAVRDLTIAGAVEDAMQDVNVILGQPAHGSSASDTYQRVQVRIDRALETTKALEQGRGDVRLSVHAAPAVAVLITARVQLDPQHWETSRFTRRTGEHYRQHAAKVANTLTGRANAIGAEAEANSVIKQAQAATMDQWLTPAQERSMAVRDLRATTVALEEVRSTWETGLSRMTAEERSYNDLPSGPIARANLDATVTAIANSGLETLDLTPTVMNGPSRGAER